MLSIFKKFIFVIIYLCVFIFYFSWAEPQAFLSKTTFELSDKNECFLTVNKNGYYSIKVKSANGTKIKIIDRMSGVLAENGEAGSQDGRIDILLQKGDYKIILERSESAPSKAVLNIESFQEKNTGVALTDLPLLNEFNLIQTTLNDLEIRSYWIILAKKEEVRFEALGRALTGCTIWLNGEWLIPQTVNVANYEAVSGKPMTYLEFCSVLEPGNYLVIFRGGAAKAWASEEKENPFYLRRGVTYLGNSGVKKITVSSFGRETFLVNGSANFFECSRDNLKTTMLRISNFKENQSRFYFDYSTKSAEINQKSSQPICQVVHDSSSSKKWVIIEAQPGDTINLVFFKRGLNYYFPKNSEPKNYWISSLVSSAGLKMIDVTPILYLRDNNNKIFFLKHQALSLSGQKPFIQQFNLFGTATAYLFVEESGAYRIAEDTTSAGRALYRLSLLEERWAGKPLTEYKTPNTIFELKRGYYLLEIRPTTVGILKIAIFKDGNFKVNELFNKTLTEPSFSFVWPQVKITENKNVVLTANERSGLEIGYEIRELPLVLTEPLSFYCRPKETVELRVKVEKEGILYYEAKGFSVKIKNQKVESGTILKEGEYILTVTNEKENIDYINLAINSILETKSASKLILKSPEQLYPVCEIDKPYFTNFEKNQSKDVLLKVKEPGFFRIETTGRLALSVKVRRPLSPSLFSASENWAGRNVLIIGYLIPGSYLINISANGNSKGLAGLILKKVYLKDEGVLPEEMISRRTVEAETALKYKLNVTQADDYSIATYGLGIQFAFRLEDEDGFPQVAQGITGQTVRLTPGNWAYYSFPQAFSTRRITQFKRLKKIKDLGIKNLKENTLILNQAQSNIWEESALDTPDIYYLSVPALLEVSFKISAGMLGTLVKKGEKEEISLPGGSEIKLKLLPAEYEIRVKPFEKQNLLRYSIEAKTEMLASGLEKEISVFPTEITISAFGNTFFELWSFGLADIKASLWDESGKQILAENDDMENDWNFKITKHLPDGFYKLKLEKAGLVEGKTKIFMMAKKEEKSVFKGFPLLLEEKLEKNIIKTTISSINEGILYLRVLQGNKISFAVYRGDRLLTENKDKLFIPIEKKTDYVLYIWQETEIAQAVKIEGELVIPQQLNISNQSSIINCPSFLTLKNNSNLSYRFYDPRGVLLFSPGWDQPFKPATNSPQAFLNKTGFLAVADGKTLTGLKIEPFNLYANLTEQINLEAGFQSFGFSFKDKQLYLIEAEAFYAPAGILCKLQENYKQEEFDWNGVAISDFKSYCLVPQAGKYQGKFWSTIGRLDERLKIKVKSFVLAPAINLGEGGLKTVELDKAKGLLLDLPSKEGVIRLLLSKGQVASIWKDGLAIKTFVAKETSCEISFKVNGGSLALVNNTEIASLVGLEFKTKNDSYTDSFVLTGSGLYKSFINSSLFSLIVPASLNDKYIFLAGNLKNLILKAKDGRLYQPQIIKTKTALFMVKAKEGEIEIENARGPFLAMVADTANPDQAFAGERPASSPQVLVDRVLLQPRVQNWSFKIETSVFVAIEMDGAGQLALYDTNKKLIKAEFGLKEEVKLLQYLEKGNYELVSRAFEPFRVGTQLSIKKINIIPLDSLKPETKFIIGAEDVYVFSFKVKEEALVGAGLICASENLSLILCDSQNNILGEGLIVFKRLKPATYFIIVKGIILPLSFKPVVYGNKGILNQIPKEVLDKYQNIIIETDRVGAE